MKPSINTSLIVLAQELNERVSVLYVERSLNNYKIKIGECFTVGPNLYNPKSTQDWMIHSISNCNAPNLLKPGAIFLKNDKFVGLYSHRLGNDMIKWLQKNYKKTVDHNSTAPADLHHILAPDCVYGELCNGLTFDPQRERRKLNKEKDRRESELKKNM